ncbi:hypothetical protein [Desulfoluna sp.]|uniref:hypothetical protein n=1 Tax=Desulfoluna sp. TaxID=2045199 RepID=UPI0026053076|nr:hypothetical protein [Desulfoluna sp.]
MKRIITFITGQWFLLWVLSFTVFLTSGNGENWARWQWGIKYDANEWGGMLVSILLVMLLSGAALVWLYYYFIKHWAHWREQGVVSVEKTTMIATIPPGFLFFVLNGFDPFFPVFRFIAHLFTAGYGMPRLMTYLALPLLGVALLGWVFPIVMEGSRKIALSIVASWMTIPVITFTDGVVGGTRSGWTGYLNLADTALPVYVAASVPLAYIGSVVMLTALGKRREKQVTAA